MTIIGFLEAVSPSLRDWLDRPRTIRESIRRENLRNLLQASNGRHVAGEGGAIGARASIMPAKGDEAA